MSPATTHSSCATAPARIPPSGPSQSPIADCNHPNGLKELANHTYRNTPTASENAFVNRYTKVGGGKGRRRQRRTRRRSSSRCSKTRTRTKRRGGIGYRLDLSVCPDGGIAHPVRYETNASSMDGGGGKRNRKLSKKKFSQLQKRKTRVMRGKKRHGGINISPPKKGLA